MEPPSSHSISIINDFGRRAPRSLLTVAIAATLDLHARSGESVNVLLTSDEQVRSLNLQFRGLDETTDVLTFSSEDVPGAGLGDIAISVPYATRQAMQRQVTTDQELAFLAIHGVLHLLGYDDVEDEARNQMMREMHRVASSIGLPEESAWSSLLHEEAAS